MTIPTVCIDALKEEVEGLHTIICTLEVIAEHRAFAGEEAAAVALRENVDTARIRMDAIMHRIGDIQRRYPSN